MVLKKLLFINSFMFLFIVLVGCHQSSEGGNQNSSFSKQNKESREEVKVAEKEEKMIELTEDWANALKTRDGKPRYEMMSNKAKQKFEQEQIQRSGENWNYNIGDSSPWVVSL